MITMLYGWTVALPHEAKISEAYRMLKAQGERETALLRPPRNIAPGTAARVVSLGPGRSVQPLSAVVFVLGVVLADPELPSEAALTPAPSPRPLDPVFADEKQSKVKWLRPSAFGAMILLLLGFGPYIFM